MASYSSTVILSLFFAFLIEAQTKTREAFIAYKLGERFSQHHQFVDSYKHVV